MVLTHGHTHLMHFFHFFRTYCQQCIEKNWMQNWRNRILCKTPMTKPYSVYLYVGCAHCDWVIGEIWLIKKAAAIFSCSVFTLRICYISYEKIQWIKKELTCSGKECLLTTSGGYLKFLDTLMITEYSLFNTSGKERELSQRKSKKLTLTRPPFMLFIQGWY